MENCRIVFSIFLQRAGRLPYRSGKWKENVLTFACEDFNIVSMKYFSDFSSTFPADQIFRVLSHQGPIRGL